MSQWKKRLAACAMVGAVILAVPTAVFAVKSLLEANPPAPAETVTVSAARIQANAPAAGQAPRSITVDGDDYVIDSFQWMEGGNEVAGVFEAGKTYSLQVTLKANSYAALSAFQPTVSGAESVSDGVLNQSGKGNAMTFTATFPKVPDAVNPPAVKGPTFLSYQNGEVYLVSKFSDAENALYNLGPKGPNHLFEFKRVSFVGAGTKGLDAIRDGGWTLLSNGTDFFVPYIINAASSPAKSSPFTGGNHGYKDSGSTDDPENTPTARMISLKVFADGQEVQEGFSGYVDEITFQWVNMVQAANTVKPDGSGREVLKEEYEMVYDGEKFNIHNVITILETSYISTYYGLAFVIPWATDGVHYVDSANTTPWNSNLQNSDCGDKTCSEVLFKRGRYHCSMSIDPTVGIGSREYLYDGAHPYAAFSIVYGGTSGKTYFHLFRNVPDPFEAGTVMEFKGGYRFYYQ